MKKAKHIFFTSDWHVGHDNVIKFDQRPFKDTDHMHRVLINNYNSSVTENDICYFAGDMGFCKAETLAKIMEELNGTKVLLLGNHDRNTYSMYSQGFDVVLNTAVFYIGKSRVSISHCPLPGIPREDISEMKGSAEGENWHGESRQQMFTSQDPTVDYHLHGHCHKTPEERETDKQFDIGVRANNYRPVSISQIESWIAKNANKTKS